MSYSLLSHHPPRNPRLSGKGVSPSSPHCPWEGPVQALEEWVTELGGPRGLPGIPHLTGPLPLERGLE